MRSNVMLMMLLCMAVIAPAHAQDDDYGSSTETKWRWKFYPITSVTQKDGKQTVRISLDRNDRYRFYTKLEEKQDYRSANSGEVKTFPITPGKNDSLNILRPFKKEDNKYVDLRLPILEQVYIDDKKTFTKALDYQLPAGSTVMKGDLVRFEIENDKYNDSLLLYRLEDMGFGLLSADGNLLFEHAQYWTSAAREMEAVKTIKEELNQAGDYFKDKLTDTYIQTGTYAGKTAPQVLMAATEKDVIGYLNYILSNPRQFIGTQFNVSEWYCSWVKAGEPKGTFGPLKLDQECAKWIKMALIEVDLDAGTINKMPVQQALNNWKTLFPWYDGDEKAGEDDGEKKTVKTPYYDYSLLGNGLTYFPKQKALKIILASHHFLQYSKLKEGTPKELKQKLGAPARQLNNGSSWLYATPFGTIEFYVNSFYGNVTCIYLYPVKPAAVVLAEPM